MESGGHGREWQLPLSWFIYLNTLLYASWRSPIARLHLGPSVGDDELLLVIESFTTRLENSMPTLATAHLSDVGCVADYNSTAYETPRWVYLGVDGSGLIML